MIQIADWKISKEIFRNEPIAGKKEIFFFFFKKGEKKKRKERGEEGREEKRKERNSVRWIGPGRQSIKDVCAC